ncbi:hypothetical protein [Bradyrhizobium sp. URHD0069]|uniref:hypothetical protein n=1 Tax=Bradyrhizobium sp. URHD0069 TaxID=1380355 RepID=UPI0012DF2EB4|nr:hypothetical protein [Bradyrhizobium sp. URHD0069]
MATQTPPRIARSPFKEGQLRCSRLQAALVLNKSTYTIARMEKRGEFTVIRDTKTGPVSLLVEEVLAKAGIEISPCEI